MLGVRRFDPNATSNATTTERYRTTKPPAAAAWLFAAVLPPAAALRGRWTPALLVGLALLFGDTAQAQPYPVPPS